MGRGWNVAVGIVSDTTWVTPQAWRIVSRGSSTRGAPIGSGFSALIFFGSFLYQDKKERINRSLPCFPVAMQRFSVVLCIIQYVHRQTIWIPQYPGLKPRANVICPFRAINVRVQRRMLTSEFLNFKYIESPRLVRNDNIIASLTPFVMLNSAEASLCTFNPSTHYESLTGNRFL